MGNRIAYGIVGLVLVADGIVAGGGWPLGLAGAVCAAAAVPWRRIRPAR